MQMLNHAMKEAYIDTHTMQKKCTGIHKLSFASDNVLAQWRYGFCMCQVVDSQADEVGMHV